MPKKYVEVAINNFIMHLIISKWLRRQKCRQKRKTMRQEEREVKEKTDYETVCFHSFKYVTGHRNVRFFF